jgi:hypothetical protein
MVDYMLINKKMVPITTLCSTATCLDFAHEKCECQREFCAVCACDHKHQSDPYYAYLETAEEYTCIYCFIEMLQEIVELGN